MTSPNFLTIPNPFDKSVNFGSNKCPESSLSCNPNYQNDHLPHSRRASIVSPLTVLWELDIIFPKYTKWQLAFVKVKLHTITPEFAIFAGGIPLKRYV